MGCRWSTENTSIKCLLQLREVQKLVQDLQDKYKKQKNLLDQEIQAGLKHKESKQTLIHKLKRKKILEHYMNVCSKRIDVLMNKEYAVEQLNITALQIKALKQTVGVFDQFNKSNKVDQIEKLQDTLQNLTDDVTDVNGLLESQPILEFDEEELEQELQSLEQPSITPLATVPFPVAPLEIKVDQDVYGDTHPKNVSSIHLEYA